MCRFPVILDFGAGRWRIVRITLLPLYPRHPLLISRVPKYASKIPYSFLHLKEISDRFLFRKKKLDQSIFQNVSQFNLVQII